MNASKPASPSLKAKLILLGATTIFALGFAECGLRIVKRGGSGWAKVPPIEARLAAVPPKTGKRALALGDSFTEYKDDVGKNWFRFALQGLDGWDGVNLGQTGTGLAHYRLNLDTHARALAPDLVVTALYLGNDLQDYEIVLAKEARGIAIEPVSTSTKTETGVVATLSRASVLFATVARLTKRSEGSVFDHNLALAAKLYAIDDEELQRRLAKVDPDLLQRARSERVNPWDLAFAIVRPTRYADVTLQREGTDGPRALERFLADLEAFHTACSAIARCAYVVIPAPPQVHARFADYLLRTGYELPTEVVGDSPLMVALRGFLRGHGMPFVDLVEVLATHADDDLFLPDDVHLNDHGQKLAGDAVRALFDLRTPPPAPTDSIDGGTPVVAP